MKNYENFLKLRIGVSGDMKKIITLLSILTLILLLIAYYDGTGTEGTEKVLDTYSWKNSKTSYIALEGNSITLSGGGAMVNGSMITIMNAGTYDIRGTLDDGQIIVNAKGTDIVKLVLNGVDISCSTSSPIYVVNAEETIIILADGTENYVTDGESYMFKNSTSDDPNAAIFSKDDLAINGNGSLTVNAHYNNGIQSKDDLEITGGDITVNAVNDGIKGRDSIVVKDAKITVNAGADGMQSNNDEDPERGYVSIESGIININAEKDGIQAETRLTIGGGNIQISSGAKGLKAGIDMKITDGNISINSSDDSIHSNDGMTIINGNIILASGDDAIHSDSTLEINGGDIRITKCYEGIESSTITINGGTIHLVASDDGINAVSNNDDTLNGLPVRSPRQPGQANFDSAGDNHLYINGGYIVIDATGDGLDINGPISMTEGVVIINGPTRNDNGALDYSGTFEISGGFLVAVGSSGMAQSPSASSTQHSVKLNLPSPLLANTIIHIETEDGEEILTFVPTKEYQSVVLCSPKLENGENYSVYSGGSSSGSFIDGIYSGETYTGGTQITSFTISSMVTNVGSTSYGGGLPDRRPP